MRALQYGIRQSNSKGVPSISNFVVTPYDPDAVDVQKAIISFTPNSKFETEIFQSIDNGEFILAVTLAKGVGYWESANLFDGREHTVAYYAQFKNDLTVLNPPVIDSASAVNGKVRVIYDDNNVDAEIIEMEASIDAGEFQNVSNINQGVELFDHIVTCDDSIIYRARAKEGTLPVLSSYSNQVTFNPSYCIEAKAVFDKIKSLSSTMTLKNKMLLDAYIKGLKDYDLWQLIYALWLLLEGNVNGKINIKNPTSNYAAEYGAGAALSWTLNDGVKGSKTQNRGIDLNFNPVTEGVDVNSFAAHWYGRTGMTGGHLFGYYVSPYICLSVSGSVYAMCNAPLTVVPAGMDYSQHGCLERSASNREDIYRNGVSVANNTKTAGALPNHTLYLLNSRADATTPSDIKLALFGFTKKMTAQQHSNFISVESALLNR